MSDPQKLAAAPTHVPPPRTAFLEHCEVEIYEGLTYVRLDDVMHLLSESTPSEEQIERAAVAMQNESGGFFSLESWRHLARVALTAAGVAPQEPSQNETKSGNNFVSLDPEKVAEVIEQMRDRARKERDVTKESLGQFISRALCEAYTEGKLT